MQYPKKYNLQAKKRKSVVYWDGSDGLIRQYFRVILTQLLR